jgi:hypothetical protein
MDKLRINLWKTGADTWNNDQFRIALIEIEKILSFMKLCLIHFGENDPLIFHNELKIDCKFHQSDIYILVINMYIHHRWE